MRILFVSEGRTPDQADLAPVLAWARALTARGHLTALWCASDPRLDAVVDTFADFGLVRRQARRALGSWWNSPARHWAQDWQAMEPDLVHLHGPEQPRLRVLLSAARQLGLPWLATMRAHGEKLPDLPPERLLLLPSEGALPVETLEEHYHRLTLSGHPPVTV